MADERQVNLSIHFVPRNGMFIAPDPSSERRAHEGDLYEQLQAMTGHPAEARCSCCHVSGPEAKLQAVERWEYDLERNVQKLSGADVYCGDCAQLQRIPFPILKEPGSNADVAAALQPYADIYVAKTAASREDAMTALMNGYREAGKEFVVAGAEGRGLRTWSDHNMDALWENSLTGFGAAPAPSAPVATDDASPAPEVADSQPRPALPVEETATAQEPEPSSASVAGDYGASANFDDEEPPPPTDDEVPDADDVEYGDDPRDAEPVAGGDSQARPAAAAIEPESFEPRFGQPPAADEPERPAPPPRQRQTASAAGGSRILDDIQRLHKRTEARFVEVAERAQEEHAALGEYLAGANGLPCWRPEGVVPYSPRGLRSMPGLREIEPHGPLGAFVGGERIKVQSITGKDIPEYLRKMGLNQAYRVLVSDQVWLLGVMGKAGSGRPTYVFAEAAQGKVKGGPRFEMVKGSPESIQDLQTAIAESLQPLIDWPTLSRRGKTEPKQISPKLSAAARTAGMVGASRLGQVLAHYRSLLAGYVKQQKEAAVRATATAVACAGARIKARSRKLDRAARTAGKAFQERIDISLDRAAQLAVAWGQARLEKKPGQSVHGTESVEVEVTARAEKHSEHEARL